MQNKLYAIGILSSVVMLTYLFILIKLQVIEQTRFNEQVRALISRENHIQSLRGRIYDRNKDTPLAYNESKYQIYIYPKIFEDAPSTIHYTAQVLGLSVNNIKDALSQKNRNFVVIRDLISYKDLVGYMEKINDIKGLEWRRIVKRKYEFGDSMAHVIGYVGDISAAELQIHSYQGYTNLDAIGKSGVEKQYEEYLRGKSGTLEEFVNVFGQGVDDSEKIVQSVTLGNDLVLTLDRNIQQILEQAIGDRVGSGVIMNPHTGEILAMASNPTFNPNQLVKQLNLKDFLEIQENENYPFLNRTIQSVAPPASTFKVLMSLALLSEDPNNSLGYWSMKIHCPGYLKIGNRIFYCWNRAGHGYLNYVGALKNSSNVFFYHIGTEILGQQKIHDYARDFGLGTLTGIDLPGEKNGNLPSAGWKESRLREFWTAGDTANMSIGQGYTTVTPLQMASLLSTVLNDGVKMKPHVLKEIRDQETGKHIQEITPTVEKRIDISPAIFKAIRSALRQTAESGSSSPVLSTKAIKIAGKTGSAQVEGGEFEKLHSWYISFGPYDAPVEDQVVMVIWIDAKNEWEWWAPKAANIIYQAIFANQSFEEAKQTLIREGASWL